MAPGAIFVARVAPGNAACLGRSYATDGSVAPALQIAGPLLGGLGGTQALTVHALTLELIEYRDQNAQPAGRTLAREFVQGNDIAYDAAVKSAPDETKLTRIFDLHPRLGGGATHRIAESHEARPPRHDIGHLEGVDEQRDDPPHALRPEPHVLVR